MPVQPSKEISSSFKAKWLKHHPEDKERGNTSLHLDDSLTSLQWLQDFSILSVSLAGTTCQSNHLAGSSHPHPMLSGFPCSPSAGDTAVSGMPQNTGSPIACSASANWSSYSSLLQTAPKDHHQSIVPAKSPEEVDYKTNRQVKPPYSYATLICMAMQASMKNKITLSSIYNWITGNFCYYRHAEPSWQNSIRHNLSLNKCFMKVPRQKDEPGKGGFWQIDPQYAHMFVNGVFRRRRMHGTHFNTQNHRKSHGSSHNYNIHGSSHNYNIHGSSHNYNIQTHHQHVPQAQLRVSHRVTGAGNEHSLGGSNWTNIHKSPLLTSNESEPELLKGELDWASVFDDILNGSSNDFEDLGINLALNSLGCEEGFSQQYQSPGWHPGKWCRDRVSGDDEQACRYLEMNDDIVGCYSMEEIQQRVNMTAMHQQPFPLVQTEQFQEGWQRHPWEEMKEELQEVPITLDYTVNYCEGFISEMQPWRMTGCYM
ncbi:hypothetical protein UPYG_G00100290 [Umbra pygmaea]|uniref:Fork-head domain-containing protein n=1 Tax=Umbra pygmaea TaxID=75934 RepID=A0ABD0X0J6_UMBPY